MKEEEKEEEEEEEEDVGGGEGRKQQSMRAEQQLDNKEIKLDVLLEVAVSIQLLLN